VKFGQLLFVRRRGAWAEFDLAAVFVEHKHDGRSGMVQNVCGFHVQQNQQRAATKFWKTATKPLKKQSFVAGLVAGVS
jgi:hypothetical protein